MDERRGAANDRANAVRRPGGVTVLGVRTRFVLSTSGHIAAIVNPPGNKRASPTADERTPPDASEWEELATTREGTWWEDFDHWLAERSRAVRPAPTRLANRRHKIVGAAPGECVLEP